MDAPDSIIRYADRSYSKKERVEVRRILEERQAVRLIRRAAVIESNKRR